MGNCDYRRSVPKAAFLSSPDTASLHSSRELVIRWAHRLQNYMSRRAFHDEGMGLPWPNFQRTIPRIAPVARARTTQIYIMQPGRQVSLVDVPFGKHSSLHPVDPNSDWDIDSQRW